MASALLLVGLEAAAYLGHGLPAWFAARVWIVHGAVSLAFASWIVILEAIECIRRRNVLMIVAIGWAGWLAFYGAGSWQWHEINCEATQELGDAVSLVREPDLGYTRAAFLGYPARQYLVAALPTLLTGRSLLALRLGFTIPFFIGALVLAAGMRRWFAVRDPSGRVAAFGVLVALSCSYLPEFIWASEQTLLPVSLTMLSGGLVMAAIADLRPLPVIAMAWPLAMLGTSYTPSLASLALILVLMALLIAREVTAGNRARALLLVGPVFLAVGLATCSLLVRGDLRGGSNTTAAWLDRIAMLREGATITLFGFPRPFFSAPVLVLILVYLALALAGRLRLVHFITGAWVGGTLLASVVLSGYASPPPTLGLHRALVVMPVLGWAIAELAVGSDHVRAVLRRPLAQALAAILFLTFAGWDAWRARDTSSPSEVDAAVADLATVSREIEAGGGAISSVAFVGSHPRFQSVSDALKYFLPNTTIVPPQEAYQVAPESGVRVVYADDETFPATADRRTWTVTRLHLRMRDGSQRVLIRAVHAPTTLTQPD